MVAVVITVFHWRSAEQAGKTELAAQHGRHAAGNGAHLRADKREILAGNAREIGGIIEGSGQEILFIP